MGEGEGGAERSRLKEIIDLKLEDRTLKVFTMQIKL